MDMGHINIRPTLQEQAKWEWIWRTMLQEQTEFTKKQKWALTSDSNSEMVWDIQSKTDPSLLLQELEIIAKIKWM